MADSIGTLATYEYLEKLGIIQNDYKKFNYRPDLTYASSGVLTASSDDTSPVYEIVFNGNSLNGCNSVIDYIGSMLMRGDLYVTSYRFLSVAKDASVYAHFIPNGLQHLRVIVTADAKTYIDTYGNTTYTDNGTQMVGFNRNDFSDHTTTAMVYHTPTINVLGAQGAQELLNGGTGPSAIGGTYQGGVSVIGNNLTDVLVKLTNKSATGASDIVIIFEWTNE